mgnify:CR=1 FL=1
MKTIEKIITNPIIIFIIMINDIINVLGNITPLQINSYGWFDFIIKFLIAIALWLILKAYFKLKNEFNDRMRIFNIISHIRNKRLFIKSFEDVQFFRGLNETDQEFWKRLPQGGLFNAFFKEEFEIVKKRVQAEFKDKNQLEIKKLLLEYYPIKDEK